MKLAIVYDWIDTWGGAERILLQLHKMYPNADFYTAIHFKERAPWAQHISFKVSLLDNLPRWIKSSRSLMAPFFAYGYERFDFTSYDMVFSITSSFSKAIVTWPHTKHYCYLLTPPRYLWGLTETYLQSYWKPLNRLVLMPMIRSLRKEDQIFSARPDKIFSISQVIANRCKHYYHRDSEVIYPPFDYKYWRTLLETVGEAHFRSDIPENYFLVVSRLEAYKHIELAIDVCNETKDMHLVIVGKGRMCDKLKQRASSRVRFISGITDAELVYFYHRAQALIMPQEEDFGFVALESMTCGTPVIAFARGGAAETVMDGTTGILFFDQSVGGLKEALARFHTLSYNLHSNLKEPYEYLKRFDLPVFVERFSKVIPGYTLK